MKTLLANVITPWIHGITVRFCRLITLQLCRRALAGVLVAGAVVLAGCSNNREHARWLAEFSAHREHIADGHLHYFHDRQFPSLIHSGGVLGACTRPFEITKAAWDALPSDERYPKKSVTEHTDYSYSWEREYFVVTHGRGDYHDEDCNETGGSDRRRYLTFSSVQLDEDVISITATPPDSDRIDNSTKVEWLDKYTLLVVAEKGKSLGFKYAVFAATENRDESVTTPLETKTTTSSSDSGIDLTSYVQGYYPSLGIGTSTSSSSTTTKTTTTGGETTTTYKRVHTVKYSNEKLPNAINLELVAKSIKGDEEWVIDL